ncbi:POK25 protein, partial [Alopecoenas beccarii]|nr:POK25 protein [Alopecoenas beccarii]
PLTWLTDDPVWVDQWPLTEERLQKATELVAEQLAAGHIKPSTSPWNTPIFIIPKKSGKWCLLHDLQKVNEQMQAMGALQPGLPSPAMLPENWNILIVDLKDWFFTIPLHEQDTQRFAFTVPAINKSEPAKIYEWVVLPQGMKNSPTLCQMYVAWALQPIRRLWSQTIIYHYMDDILCCQEAGFTDDLVQQLALELGKKALIIAPEKVQQSAPWKYLGWSISDAQIRPQKLELHTDLQMLNDVQKLLGDIQWIQTCVGITSAEIAPLTSLLRGSNPTQRIVIEPQHQQCLNQILQKIQQNWTSRRLNTVPISLLISNSDYRYLMFKILEWVFLSIQPRFSIQTCPEAVGELIRKGRTRIVEISGHEPADISIPVNAADLEWWVRHSSPIQEALLGFTGKVHSQQPKNKVWNFLRNNAWLECSKVQKQPLQGLTVYTDAGKREHRAVCVWQEKNQWKHHLIQGTKEDSLQTLELTAVIWALTNWMSFALNVVTDSLYVAGVAPRIENALLRQANNPRLGKLFIQLHTILQQRTEPCCVIHIRSHQWNMGL